MFDLVRNSKNRIPWRVFVSLAWVWALTAVAGAQSAKKNPWAIDESNRAGEMLARYFKAETEKLRDRCLADVKSLDDWEKKKEVYRKQLFEMLSLDPLPDKTDLKAMVTGKVDHEEFTVENIHFQSMPGLYVTGNLYIPKNMKKPAPTILYVCGHAKVVKNGVSYGNKTSYQHHGGWFARHGYVCLIIDTLQLGEIEGRHHGTYRYGEWRWNCRGYSPAGVEAWNCVRALDYLETRDEVDAERFGVTGRSGGGAYSWWIAALDERIKAAVPVAGITDLENHVLTGCVEGHCDCMFFVNTFRWDYPQVAALVAPRPLLISNSDKDRIFPLDGVGRIHRKVRDIYDLYGAGDKLGLNITEGPHKDTQELRVHAFVWFNRFLKEDASLIHEPAEKFFEPEQLKVFKDLPQDEINTRISESFTRLAPKPEIPDSKTEWEKQRDGWMTALKEKVFRGWPLSGDAGSLELKRAYSEDQNGLRLTKYEFRSQPNVPLEVFTIQPAEAGKLDKIVLHVLDEAGWKSFAAAAQAGFPNNFSGLDLPEPDAEAFVRLQSSFRVASGEIKHTMGFANVYVASRGIGPSAWLGDEKKQIQIRRRFMLLGQTLDGMRVWDVRRAVRALSEVDSFRGVPVWLHGKGQMAGIALYASLFEPSVAGLDLHSPPASHQDGPIFLNVLRYLDMPQAMAMAAEKSMVRIRAGDSDGWEYPRGVVEKLGWGQKQIQSIAVPKISSH